MGGLFLLFLERGPRIGSPPTFWSFVLGLGAVMAWVCHLADVLGAYTEAQVEVDLSAVLDLVSSNQFMLCPQRLCHSLEGCTLRLPVFSA